MLTQTLENATSSATQAEPIRVIRKINGKYQWIALASEAEMTEDERRAQYCSAFGVYA